MRKFEKVQSIELELINVKLPERSTKNSARI